MPEKQEKQTPTACFVYGTLLRDKANHRLVSHAKKILPAFMTSAILYDLPYGYPAIVQANDGIVHGELCFFDEIESELPSIDLLEGYNPATPRKSLYIRTVVDVKTEDGQCFSAYTYFAGPLLTSRIPSIGNICKNGIWR